MSWRTTTEQDGDAISVTPRTRRTSPALVGAAIPSVASVATASLRRTPRANRALSPNDAASGDTLWFEWRGHRVAYTRRGAGAMPLLLVHGVHVGASSYEWRQVADALAAEHPVFTLDLLGFGQSSRPRATYTPHVMQSLIADFVSHVIAQPTVLVAAERSAAYAIALGARNPERFPAIIAVGPTGLVHDDRDDATLVVARSARLPLVGSLLYRARVTRDAIRARLKRSYADRDLVTASLVEVYFDEAHRDGARFVAPALAEGALDLDVRATMRRLSQPLLLVWGARASIVPADASLGFRALKRDAELALIDLAGDLPHDERPAEFLRATLDFLARVRRGREMSGMAPVVSLQTA